MSERYPLIYKHNKGPVFRFRKLDSKMYEREDRVLITRIELTYNYSCIEDGVSRMKFFTNANGFVIRTKRTR